MNLRQQSFSDPVLPVLRASFWCRLRYGAPFLLMCLRPVRASTYFIATGWSCSSAGRFSKNHLWHWHAAGSAKWLRRPPRFACVYHPTPGRHQAAAGFCHQTKKRVTGERGKASAQAALASSAVNPDPCPRFAGSDPYPAAEQRFTVRSKPGGGGKPRGPPKWRRPVMIPTSAK